LNLADGDWSLEVVGEEGLEVVGEEGLEVGCNKRKVIGQAGRSRRYEKAGIVVVGASKGLPFGLLVLACLVWP
jgi:hypothetical protein